MQTRTQNLKPDPLGSALPHAVFTERHSRVIDATPEAVWRELHELRWSDLTITKLFTFVRAGGRARRLDVRLVDPPSPGAPLEECEPSWSTSGMIGKPWHPVPVRGPELGDLADLAAFDEPGWLKYGMQWVLTPMPDGRTRLETTTRCQPTDTRAAVLFAGYWAVIRIPSGIIRRDIMRAVAVRVARRTP